MEVGGRLDRSGTGHRQPNQGVPKVVQRAALRRRPLDDQGVAIGGRAKNRYIVVGTRRYLSALVTGQAEMPNLDALEHERARRRDVLVYIRAQERTGAPG